MMDLVLPGINNYDFARRIDFLVKNLPIPIPGLALTACRPSVTNGFRDLTPWCSKMQERREQIEKDIFLLYGKSSKGIYEVALAEWKYETNRVFEALLLVADTIPTLDNADDIRCLVAAYALQMRILILNGQAKCSDDIFEKIFEKIRAKHYEEMESSLRAVRCLFDCYEGKKDKIEEWLEQWAPNENLELFTMDMYDDLTKTEKAVLVLLAEGLSNDDIGRELNKKSGSIKFHTSGIYKKLKVENRQQAINVARSLGIV